MSPRPRVLALQHQDTCPPGWFGEWLEGAGVAVEPLPLHHGAAVPDRLDDWSGLLVLGGRVGATDDEVAPWLPGVRDSIREAVDRGLPLLGICLGHQLAAAALGGRVERNRHGRARGLTPVRLSPEAARDPLFAIVPSGALAVQWNNDVVTGMPEGSRVLATAPDGTVQAARFGPQAWGVQFHPEASPAIFRAWSVDDPDLDRSGLGDLDVAQAAEQVAAHEDRLREDWGPLARRFAAIVTAHASGGARTGPARQSTA
ncbi:MAG TPA: type 1 glutamine amidotransferase [Ornithinicoccus sp.]|nr:type 1 glutamine amidotransferase [Ornithinicoccus sp.]